MKKFFSDSLLAIIILVVTISGCRGGNSGGTPPASFSIAESLVPGATSFPTGISEPYTNCTTVNYPYYIAKYEVTYVLWKEVYDWAQSHGYTLNPGKRGGGWANSSPNTEVFFDSGHESDPVTYINWYDAIVWCNALTEYYNEKKDQNLECVYKDSEGNLIKNSTDKTIITYLKSMNDFNRSANGFRLPTSMEWELAARYKDGSTWTPGNYASGAAGPCTDPDATGAAAWYEINSIISTNPYPVWSTQPVGQKPAHGNALNLYDMSGNVWEWCFDWYPEYECSSRVVRGGYYASANGSLRIGSMSYSDPGGATSGLGIRPVRTK
ncbi:MAG: formylglycine-generating enzyme family protein [Firmicutes bacterium]|nr:formylglycine-generating enzyme family protein [Bacillota bacterium]